MAWWKRGDSVGQPEPNTPTRNLPYPHLRRNYEFGAEVSGGPPVVPGLSLPGVNNRLTVPHEPHGADRRPGWRNVDPNQWGAHAVVRFGMLIYNPNTARMTVQELGPRSLCFTNVAQETGMELQNRPALEGPRYRFTAVNDTAVIAQARQRAQARASAPKGARAGVKL